MLQDRLVAHRGFQKCYPENIANQVDKLDALLETIDVVPFNDDPSTTHDQIVALLEKAQI